MCKCKTLNNSGQSTSMLKGCMYIYVLCSRYSLYLWKSIDRLLISSGISQGKRKYSVCHLKCTFCCISFVGQEYHGYQYEGGCEKFIPGSSVCMVLCYGWSLMECSYFMLYAYNKNQCLLNAGSNERVLSGNQKKKMYIKGIKLPILCMDFVANL